MMDSETSLAVTSASPLTAGRQERFVRTRQDLLDAAREIFARDGFDSARIQDIATLAGKTRGAFYAHFQNKEDVFFAIFDQDIDRDSEEFASHLRKVSSTEERMDALVEHVLMVLRERRRILLHLEFKMYALRHPARQRRLADLYAAMCISEAGDEWERILPELASRDKSVQRTQGALFGAVIDGVGLTLMFDHGALDDETVRRQVRACVQTMMWPEGKPRSA